MNNITQPAAWRDEDAIAQPGQALSEAELAHLLALANGNTPNAITRMHGTSATDQRRIESGLRAKLGAVSKPHMIARAFVLNVLLPRALIVFLAIATLGASQHTDAIAQRPARRPRTSVSAARLVRNNRSSGSPS